VEAGRLELELARFHLPTALDNALTLVREQATRHGITLTQRRVDWPPLSSPAPKASISPSQLTVPIHH
jgi:hypothetical protein